MMFSPLSRMSFRQCLGVAFICVAGGVMVRLAVTPLVGTEFPLITVVPAVLISSILGGWRAGVPAALLCLPAAFVGVQFGWIRLTTSLAGPVIFSITSIACLITVAAAEYMRRLVDHARATQERLMAALSASGVGTWRYDLLRDRMEWDESVARVFGVEARSTPTTRAGLLELVDPQDRERVRASLNEAQATGTDGEIEYRLGGAGGTPRWVYDRYTFARDRAGRVRHMIGASLDITDRKRGEEQNAYLAAIVSSSGDAIISFDLKGTILSWNRAAETLFGYSADEVIGTSVLPLSTEASRQIAQDLTPRVVRGETVVFNGTRVRKDGSEFMAEITSTPVRNAQNRTIAISAMVRDIDRRIAADQQKELLIRELHHRVRNTLATVQGLVTASARSSPQENVAEAIADRIQALARTHSILTEDRNQSVALRDLLLLELAPYQNEGAARVSLEGPVVVLSSTLAVPLSMGVHELVTNANKHGCLSVAEGFLRVSWERVTNARGEPAVSIDWLERGGPRVEEPTSHGFGSTLLRRVLGNQLHAEVQWTFDPLGVHLIIVVPTGVPDTTPTVVQSPAAAS
jgi:PAS domain S-box-containing protein